MKKKKDITHPGYCVQSTQIKGKLASNTKLNPPLGEGVCASRQERVELRVKSGFSLIELMISLIAISLITAAFAPVISKRLSSSEFTIGVGSGGSTSNLTFDTIDNCKERFGDYCTQCWVNGKCAFCSLNCNSEVNTYIDINKCSCTPCTNVDENCITCSDSKTCTKCETGYYIKDGKCAVTPAGSYSPDGINEEQCPEGYYCEGGSEPQVCPNGTYSNKGAKSESDCNDCPQGYACNNGTKSECSAGYYSKSKASVCTNCDNFNSTNSAYYNTTSKSNTCTLCEAGNMCVNGSKTQCDNPTFATQGSTYCSECTNCTECDNKTGNCTQCTEGYFLSNNKCIECTIGYYCPGGSDSTRHECPTGCSSCTNAANCTGCKSNYQYNNGSCNPCPEGYYCSGGLETSKQCISNCKSCSNTSTCNTCNQGYYKTTSSTCSQCNKGYYCSDGINQTPCSAGTYNPNQKSTSSSACQTCASGTQQAQSSCLVCSAGTYLTGTSCTNCPVGYYCAGAMVSPVACPENTTTELEGTSSLSGCSLCVAGYYRNSSNSTCTPCAAGYYTSSANNNSACSECGPRTFSNSSASTTCQTCAANLCSAYGSTYCGPYFIVTDRCDQVGYDSNRNVPIFQYEYHVTFDSDGNTTAIDIGGSYPGFCPMSLGRQELNSYCSIAN